MTVLEKMGRGGFVVQIKLLFEISVSRIRVQV